MIFVVCFLLGNSPASGELPSVWGITQRLGNYPKENIQHTEHDESLKLGRYILSYIIYGHVSVVSAKIITVSYKNTNNLQKQFTDNCIKCIIKTTRWYS